MIDSGPEETNTFTALRSIALVVPRIFRYLWRADRVLPRRAVCVDAGNRRRSRRPSCT